MISAKLAKAGKVTAIIGLINFAVFFVVAAYIGCAAVNCHAQDGKFFLIGADNSLRLHSVLQYGAIGRLPAERRQRVRSAPFFNY